MAENDLEFTFPDDPEFHREVKRLFDEVCRLPAEEREAWLAKLEAVEPRKARAVRKLSEKDADCAASGTSPDSPCAGDHIGPYRLLSYLGGGGQGDVWLAEQQFPRRNVALKILKPLPEAAVSDPGEMDRRMRRLLREADITSHLDHPGICKIFTAGVIHNTAYIAMEYVPGETLASRISSTVRNSGQHSNFVVDIPDEAPGRAPAASNASPPSKPAPGAWIEIARVLALFEKLARALHTAHENDVIHRDVKPGNIKIKPNGEPVLLDFGLARYVGDHTIPNAVTPEGTPLYLSPEQLQPQIPLDARTDVFSLGGGMTESCVPAG